MEPPVYTSTRPEEVRERHDARIRGELLHHYEKLGERAAQLHAERDQRGAELEEIDVAREGLRRALEYIDTPRNIPEVTGVTFTAGRERPGY